uniref:IRS-type PTB domain-containing protein n=1 Tax=Parascaris univalens TaxID=6257 RepID=A0A915A8V5_PARUN
MRTSDVVFNETGRSIESSCMLFRNKKWKEFYMMCCQPNDIRNVFVFVYKNRKNRLKNKELFTVTCDTFVGFESGFLLKRERNTLCVMTRFDVVIAAFASIQTLIYWESWLHQTCCRGAMLYAQLIDAPESSRARRLLNREVRIHIHDGRFALVEGRPPRVIGYWNTSDILRAGFLQNVMHFITVEGLGQDEGIFAVVCGQIRQLEKFFRLSKKPGLLISYLNHKTADGPWMNSIRTTASMISFPVSASFDCHFEGSAENGDLTGHTDASYGTRNGVRRWDALSGAASQPSVCVTKSDSSTFEDDFPPGTCELREHISAPISQKVSGTDSPGLRTHVHGYSSPSPPLYMNYEAFMKAVTKVNVGGQNDCESATAIRHADGHFDYVNIPNTSSATKSSCDIRRASSDTPSYVNVNEPNSGTFFSTEIVDGHFSSNGGASNHCLSTPPASARVFNSELSIASTRQHEENGKCIDLGSRNTPPPNHSHSSRKVVCRAGSWPKHVCNFAEHMPGSHHLSTCSIGVNGYAFGSGCVGARSCNMQLPTTNVGGAFDYERKVASECKGKYLRQQQRGARTRGRDAASFRDKTRMKQHQRSRSVGLEATVKRSGSTREENWDRAKRIIGGARKSMNGSRSAMQSASLDKLISSPNNSSRSGLPQSTLRLEAPSPPAAAEKIPRLDIFVNAETIQSDASTSASLQGPSPIPGLVKLPPERFGLKRMGNILTKSLRKSVTGSYSKYDGERATHHYNPGDTKELPPVVDCIESAVNKGRARLIEADRRNSGFVDGIHSTNVSSHVPAHIRHRYTLTVETCDLLKPSVASARAKESGGESDAVSFNSHTLSNSSVDALAANIVSSMSRPNEVSGDKNFPCGAPPLPPKTYLKKTALEESRLPVIGERIQSSIGSVQRSLQGNYCAVVASNACECSTQRKASHEDAHTVYTQIDPVATVAATQTQADMMRERERQGAGRLIGQGAYASDRVLLTNKKRAHGSDDRNSTSKGFFARHIWRRPSKTRSHCDLRF